MTVTRHYVLAAGGTGGHMIPAYALGKELVARGHRVGLITDARGEAIPIEFEAEHVEVLPAGRLSGGPRGWLSGAWNIWKGRGKALRFLREFEPTALVGFGGYPAFPALLAAERAGIATIIHEQNAVLGRVNRLMAGRVDAIATAYSEVDRLKPKHRHKVEILGNPVRDAVLALRGEDFPPLDADGVFRVLVTGGSQGARILSEVVPAGLSMLPLSLRRRLQVTQQCRPEDIERVRAQYAEFDIPAELATYFEDMPTKLGWAHLFIGRAGASTIAELTCAGRPAILVPLPIATDDHQSANVRDMVKAGGARSIRQDNFTPKELAKQIQKLAMDPGALENAALAAHKCGFPNATSDLADLVESFGGAPLADTITFRPAKGKAVAGPAVATRTPAPADALVSEGQQT